MRVAVAKSNITSDRRIKRKPIGPLFMAVRVYALLANSPAATPGEAGGQESASWMLNRRKRKRANIADWLRFDEFCVNCLPQGFF
jgi:hypothetical protein